MGGGGCAARENCTLGDGCTLNGQCRVNGAGCRPHPEGERETGLMPRVEIHAGDFLPGKKSVEFLENFFGTSLKVKRPGRFLRETIRLTEIKSVEVASEENVKRLGGTVGWGTAGLLILGPVGLLAGLLAGGKGKNVTFVLQLKDGRRLLGTTDSRTFTKLQAATF